MNKSENIPVYGPDTTLAFIDILGFKELLAEKTLPEIIGIIQGILIFDNSEEYIRMIPTLKSKLISDSFVVYAQLTEQIHVTAFFIYLSTIIGRIHGLGKVVTRGYVSTGNHYSNDIEHHNSKYQLWISKAWVEAYNGEKKYSIHPRVIVGKSTISHIERIYPEFMTLEHFKRDTDGYLFINYLNCISEAYQPNGITIIAEPSKAKLLKSLFEHKKTIISGLEKFYEKEYASKYYWLANYHNTYINEKIMPSDKQELLINSIRY